MVWEVNYVDNINDFFMKEGLKEQDLLKIRNRMNYIAQSPIHFSERVQGTGIDNLRRVKFSEDYRMFILLDPIGEVIHCLAYLRRNHCYDKKELNKVITIVRELIKKVNP